MRASRSLSAFAIYLLVFAIAIRIFLAGFHLTALAIVLVVWAALSVWVYFSGRR